MMSALVSVDWLAPCLGQADVVVVDATFFLPQAGRDPEQEFRVGHIPGARRFDHDLVVAAGSDLPHMRPTAEIWSIAMRDLGIHAHDHVVIYDALGLFSAPRCWWLFRSFGHQRVSILNGGLPAWRRAGLPLETGHSRHVASNYPVPVDLGKTMIATLADVQSVISNAGLVIDARGESRFSGQEPEPRPGLRAGHIPGSVNLPFTELVDSDSGCLKSTEQLSAAFDARDIDASASMVMSCGSGITACVLALAQYELGHVDVRVYDGSWAEWGGRTDVNCAVTPIGDSQ